MFFERKEVLLSGADVMVPIPLSTAAGDGGLQPGGDAAVGRGEPQMNDGQLNLDSHAKPVRDADTDGSEPRLRALPDPPPPEEIQASRDEADRAIVAGYQHAISVLHPDDADRRRELCRRLSLARAAAGLPSVQPLQAACQPIPDEIRELLAHYLVQMRRPA